MTKIKTPKSKKSKEAALQHEKEEVWRRKLEQGEQAPKAYVMDQTYHLDDRVQHETFGMGLVVSLVPPGKISVFFGDGLKLMKCGG